jgi:DNA-binding MarR family transcriptional regulator
VRASPPWTENLLTSAARSSSRRSDTRTGGSAWNGYAAEAGGVSYARYEILAAVAADPAQHASSLAHHLGLSRQAISLSIRRLEEERAIRRFAVDSGVHALELTEGGREIVTAVDTVLVGLHRRIGRVDGPRRTEIHRALLGLGRAVEPVPID